MTGEQLFLPCLLASERTTQDLLGGLGSQAPLFISEEQAQKSHRSLTRTLAAEGPGKGRNVTPQSLGQLAGVAAMGIRKRR